MPRHAATARALATCVALLSSPSLGAQVAPGDTVRLRVREVVLARGTFLHADSTGVVLRPLGAEDSVHVRFDAFTTGEVWRGRHHLGSRATYGGMNIGLVAGLVVGAATTRGQRESAVSRGVVGAVLGILVGGAVGSLGSGVQRDEWREARVWSAEAAPVVAARADSGPPRAVDRPAWVAATPDSAARLVVARIEPRRERVPFTVGLGDTVRLMHDGHQLARGILVAADSATLDVLPDGSREPSRYPLELLDEAYVRRGEQRIGASAAGQGAVAGAALGAVLIGLAASEPNQHEKGLGVALSVMAAGALTLIGTAVGGVAGLAYEDRWIPFEPATLRFRYDAPTP